MITKNTTIEDLIEDYPKSVKYLSEKGIRCIKCGEPIWGTLEEACLEKNFTESAINKTVNELVELPKMPDEKNEISFDKKLEIKNIKKQ